MINFSKVARQLEEDRFQRNQAGNQGTESRRRYC